MYSASYFMRLTVGYKEEIGRLKDGEMSQKCPSILRERSMTFLSLGQLSQPETVRAPSSLALYVPLAKVLPRKQPHDLQQLPSQPRLIQSVGSASSRQSWIDPHLPPSMQTTNAKELCSQSSWQTGCTLCKKVLVLGQAGGRLYRKRSSIAPQVHL